jgi:hypothetical protein
MRYVFRFGLALALGLSLMAGCDEARQACETHPDCDDGNQCTGDWCGPTANQLYCYTNDAPELCDFDGADEFPVDGRCEEGTCKYKEPECATDADCEDDGDECKAATCDLNRRDCIYISAHEGSECCLSAEWRCYPPGCVFCDYCAWACVSHGTCQQGMCCGDWCVGGEPSNPVCVGEPDYTPCTLLDGSSGFCRYHQCCGVWIMGNGSGLCESP